MSLLKSLGIPSSTNTLHRGEPIYRSNYLHLVWDILFFGIGMAATSRFVSVFAIRLGADAADLNLIASLPALVLLISSGFGHWWLRRFASARQALVLPGFFFRFVFIVPAFAPLFTPELRVLWLIIGMALVALPQGLAAIAFVVMMREAVPAPWMTPLLSLRSLALNLGLAGAALAFGAWLEWAPFPLNYQLMFVIAFLFGLLSWRETLLIRLPDAQPAPVTAPQKQPTGAGSPWRIRAFYPVVIAILTTHITYSAINALIPMHLVENLDASEGFIAIFGLVELLAAAGISLITAQISDRIGVRAMIALSMVILAASSAIIAFSPTLWPTLIGAALSGAGWTMAAVVGVFAYFNERTTPQEMERLSGPYHQVIGIALFIGPLIGSALIGAGLSLVAVLVIGSLMRLFSAPLIDTRWLHRSAASALPQPAPVQPDRMGLVPEPAPGGD